MGFSYQESGASRGDSSVEQRARYQEELYEQSRKGQTVQERRRAEQFEQALKPRQTYEDLVEKAMLILPQILIDKAWSDQGRVNMHEMMKLLKVSQNTAYRVRRELLKHYHERARGKCSRLSMGNRYNGGKAFFQPARGKDHNNKVGSNSLDD